MAPLVASGAAFSTGTLLDGKIVYRQPVQGFRTGIEPILLAASVPARSDDRVLECGTGAGAGMLALAARVKGLSGTAVERDPVMADLAQANFIENGFLSLHVARAEVESWQGEGSYDHAFANPPWHPNNSTLPENTGRRESKSAPPELLGQWIAVMAASLRRRGTLSLVLPAALLTEAMHWLAASDCHETALLPLWPHTEKAAKVILLRAVREGRGPSRVLPGLTLHRPDGGYTDAAEAVLRRGEQLDF